MAGTIIVEGEIITKGRITVDCVGGFYHIQKDQNKIKTLSFEYAQAKSKRLAEWLRENGVYWDNPLDAWRGQPQGYKYLLDTIEKVETTCDLLDIECYALANPQLMGLEGCTIEFNGARKEVRLYGQKIKFYSLKTLSQKFGSMVDWDFDFGEIKIID